jgi:hypothetical protein
MTLRPARSDERESLIALQRQASLMWKECGFQTQGEVQTRFSAGVRMVRPL